MADTARDDAEAAAVQLLQAVAEHGPVDFGEDVGADGGDAVGGDVGGVQQ